MLQVVPLVTGDMDVKKSVRKVVSEGSVMLGMGDVSVFPAPSLQTVDGCANGASMDHRAHRSMTVRYFPNILSR